MDPTTTLAILRQLIATALRLLDDTTHIDPHAEELIDQFATHLQALDAWITRGGFLPAQWTAAQLATGAWSVDPEGETFTGKPNGHFRVRGPNGISLLVSAFTATATNRDNRSAARATADVVAMLLNQQRKRS